MVKLLLHARNLKNSMKKISISLPTLFPELLKGACEAIYRAAAPQEFELEIVIVSPFEVSGPGIVWVHEKEPRGNSAAHESAYKHSTGDYILALSDDHHLHPTALVNALRYYQSREKRFPIYSIGLHQGFSVGTLFGIYYPYFPFMSRASIDRSGGWYLPKYAAHFSDGDLGLRVWEGGGRCEVCPDAELRSISNRDTAAPESTHRSTARERDLKTFIERWGRIYGRGWNHRETRDFNLDLPMAFAQKYLLENSIFQNDPSFRNDVVEFYASIPNHNLLKWN